MDDSAPASGKMYSLTEVKQHNTEEDCWIVVHGKVGHFWLPCNGLYIYSILHIN